MHRNASGNSRSWLAYTSITKSLRKEGQIAEDPWVDLYDTRAFGAHDGQAPLRRTLKGSFDHKSRPKKLSPCICSIAHIFHTDYSLGIPLHSKKFWQLKMSTVREIFHFQIALYFR